MYRDSGLTLGFLSPPHQEACLRSLAEGLLTYSVLLKHVEREYPSNTVPSRLRNHFSRLISLIKQQVGLKHTPP